MELFPPACRDRRIKRAYTVHQPETHVADHPLNIQGGTLPARLILKYTFKRKKVNEVIWNIVFYIHLFLCILHFGLNVTSRSKIFYGIEM